MQVITESENARDIIATIQTLQETTAETTLSDTTESTPEIFRSPVREIVRVEAIRDSQAMPLDLVENHFV